MFVGNLNSLCRLANVLNISVCMTPRPAPKKEEILLVKTMSCGCIYPMINKELCEYASFGYYKFHRYMYKTLYFTSNRHGRNKYTMGICELVK